jgi:hypothetical protein
MFVIATWVLSIVSVLGVGGAIAAFIFFPAVATPILEKVTAAVLACKTCLVVAALVACSLGSFWYGRDGQYDRGYNAAIAEIAAENEHALKQAVEKRAAWKDCKARDGEWDQTTGDCK